MAGRGRPQKRCKTIKARMYKDTYEELQLKFPRQDMSDLIDIAFNTSPLKLESALRRNKKKKEDV